MNALRTAINEAIEVVEPRKPLVEVTSELETKLTRMAQTFLKAPDAKNALIDSFTDWFEAQGKKLAGITDDEYSLDDMDAIMAVVTKEFDKVLK